MLPMRAAEMTYPFTQWFFPYPLARERDVPHHQAKHRLFRIAVGIKERKIDDGEWHH